MRGPLVSDREERERVAAASWASPSGAGGKNGSARPTREKRKAGRQLDCTGRIGKGFPFYFPFSFLIFQTHFQIKFPMEFVYLYKLVKITHQDKIDAPA
jgi:hypothetical protein